MDLAHSDSRRANKVGRSLMYGLPKKGVGRVGVIRCRYHPVMISC